MPFIAFVFNEDIFRIILKNHFENNTHVPKWVEQVDDPNEGIPKVDDGQVEPLVLRRSMLVENALQSSDLDFFPHYHVVNRKNTCMKNEIVRNKHVKKHFNRSLLFFVKITLPLKV